MPSSCLGPLPRGRPQAGRAADAPVTAWQGSTAAAGATTQRRAGDLADDLVQRRFVADAPDRLWVTDITQHRTGEGWVYCAAVLDVYQPPGRGLVDR